MCIEKRFNFTLDDMAVTAPAYDHFRTRLASLVSGSPAVLKAEQINISELQVPSRPDIQTPDVELWHLQYARKDKRLDTQHSDPPAQKQGHEHSLGLDPVGPCNKICPSHAG